MNRDEIIRMAREAGGDDWGIFRDFMPEIERFAALVAAAERNRTWTKDHWTGYEQSIAAAEREACAKVCESLNEDFDSLHVEACAEVIRARGQS